MTYCYEMEPRQFAPRFGCPCRACYEAREAGLDPELLKLAYSFDFNPKRSITMPMVQPYIARRVDAYLVGHVELPEMWLSLVMGLAEQNEKLYRELGDVLARSPLPMILPLGKVEHIDGNPLNNDPANLRIVP